MSTNSTPTSKRGRRGRGQRLSWEAWNTLRERVITLRTSDHAWRTIAEQVGVAVPTVMKMAETPLRQPALEPVAEPDVVGEKRCIGCRKNKPLKSFTIANRARSITKRRARCQRCVYLQAVARKRRDPELARERRRDTLRKYKYGLTASQFEWLLDQQHHLCAICQEPLQGDKRGRVAIDHDHKSGRIRGILCYGCNWGLGHFCDEAARLRAALRYLRRPHLKIPPTTLHPRAQARKAMPVPRPDLTARNHARAGKPGRIQSEAEKRKRRKPNPKVAAANRGRSLSAEHKNKIRVAKLAYWARMRE